MILLQLTDFLYSYGCIFVLFYHFAELIAHILIFGLKLFYPRLQIFDLMLKLIVFLRQDQALFSKQSQLLLKSFDFLDVETIILES